MNRSWQLGTGLLLTGLAGYVDALGFVRLGGLYTSFMSGNTTQLAVFGAEAKLHKMLLPAILLVAFLTGSVLGSGLAILVPSRFEPCGLTQLYGLRYGTIPVVALTGGLADTVINASPAAMAAGVATGLQFHPVTADALRSALRRLCDLFADPEAWGRLRGNAMAQPVGWQRSAKAYARLFADLTRAQ